MIDGHHHKPPFVPGEARYRDANEEHPYGHGRIETLTTVVFGIVLILVALGIGYDAVQRLFNPESLLLPV